MQGIPDHVGTFLIVPLSPGAVTDEKLDAIGVTILVIDKDVKLEKEHSALVDQLHSIRRDLISLYGIKGK